MADKPRNEIQVPPSNDAREMELQRKEGPDPPVAPKIETGRRTLTALRRLALAAATLIGALFLASIIVVASFLNWMVSPLSLYAFVVFYCGAILYGAITKKFGWAVVLFGIVIATNILVFATNILSLTTSPWLAEILLVVYGSAVVYELVSRNISLETAESGATETRDEHSRFSIRPRYEAIRRNAWGSLSRVEALIQKSAVPTLLPVMLATRLLRLLLMAIDILARWLISICEAAIGDRGWLTVGSIIGAYLVVYGVVDAKRQLDENRANLERSTFVTLVSSGSSTNFVVALKNFGPIQMTTATEEPNVFKPWAWLRKGTPNREFMSAWAASQFPLCTPANCGKAEVRIDLSGANLSGVDLRSASLSDANLAGANLSGAHLPTANLSDANLSGANLSDADLSGANLRGAKLKDVKWLRAKLTRANLSGVDLSHSDLDLVDLPGANLRGANLFAADLSNADLSGADLSGADLSKAKLVYMSDWDIVLNPLSLPRVSKAMLTDARYDERTKFPNGFDPVESGMKKLPTRDQ